MSTSDRIMQLLMSSGIEVNTETGEVTEGIESIMFITAIIELEQTFKVDIPDEYLMWDFLHNVNHTAEIIERLLQENSQLEKLS